MKHDSEHQKYQSKTQSKRRRAKNNDLCSVIFHFNGKRDEKQAKTMMREKNTATNIDFLNYFATMSFKKNCTDEEIKQLKMTW